MGSSLEWMVFVGEEETASNMKEPEDGRIVYGLVWLHANLHKYKLHIILCYFYLIFLTITTIAYGVAFLPVSVASSCPRTPRSLCSTFPKPVSDAVILGCTHREYVPEFQIPFY